MKWENILQQVEVRVEDLVLMGDFMTEDFVLNNLPFLKLERNYQMVQEKPQLMVLMDILRKRKSFQHIQNYFHSYFWHLN